MNLFIKTGREGYSPEQCRRTMTAGELIEYLEQFDEDTPVYLSNDYDYTYASITEFNFRDDEEEE